ncbi:MAG: alpha/beta hydrolase [Ilumatobacteraceae bacterium]|jgi:alpha/beta superfamily hydrolase
MADIENGQDRPETPLDALGIMASQQAILGPNLRQVEMYTRRGLLSLLWHEPDAVAQKVGVVMVGGAMGGTLGPGDSLFHALGEALVAVGVPSIRLSYRKPNDMDSCCVDTAAAVQLLVGSGADAVVIMGHSFGGAVAIRVAVGLSEMVCGVVTFATQSAGCEIAGGLHSTPLLMFHGDSDSILPLEASEVVRAIAGTGDLRVMHGDDHLLVKSHDVMFSSTMEWLNTVFAGVAS